MDLKKLKFMVIDDMLTVRKVVSNQLRSLGATQVVAANDGDQAWAMLQEAAKANAPIQVIVSDWNMPNLKGIELLRLCRKDPVYKNVPFVLVTAETEMAQVAEAIRSGVDSYVVKPFSAQSLQVKLQAALQKRKVA